MEDFLYGSARIRALENRLCTKERLERLLDAENFERCTALLAEYGVEIKKDPATGNFSREATLEHRLRQAYAEVLSADSEAAFLNFWLYPYDCNNIKSAIKCFHRGIDAKEMMFDFGNLSAAQILSAVQNGNFEDLGVFAESAEEAERVFSENGNPQWVDAILDRACYENMLRAAEESEVEFLVRLVKIKIDLINLMTTLRLLRMGQREMGKQMLDRFYLDGGTLERSYLAELYEAGEEGMFERLAYSSYRKFAVECGGAGAELSKIERAADDAFLSEVAMAKFIPYGVETLTAYLLKSENEVRNLRIVLSGAEANLPKKVTGERIRMSDV